MIQSARANRSQFFSFGRGRLGVVVLFAVVLTQPAAAQDAAFKPIARRLPPPGIEIDAGKRDEVVRRYSALRARYTALRETLADDPKAALLPDIEIYLKAVGLALDLGEFWRPQDVQVAMSALDTAAERTAALQAGQHPWTTARGLVVRGYRSAIDGSVQPYGLEIPPDLDRSQPAPLYVWLHGRGDKATDLYFIDSRAKKAGQMQPSGAIVLHPFGRQCIGWKSAGEVDVLDAISSVSQRYSIDPDRVALLGFSMGGAGAWHIGAHYTDHFAVVHAGAGFAETARYTKLKPADYPPPYEQALWGVYDVPGYARNLLNVPVIAYSGEKDRQKQAADVMQEALAAQGKALPHLIGPGMGHKYHPDSKQEVLRRVAAAVVAGRDRWPAQVALQTRTLRYNRMHWVEATALDIHWRDSRIDAVRQDDGTLVVRTKNIAGLRISSPWKDQPKFPTGTVIEIDGQPLTVEDTPGFVQLVHSNRWQFDVAPRGRDIPPKKPGLQGPIDDVLLEPFLVVLPSGKPAHPRVARWVDFELEHFRRRWRALYRGELRTRLDRDVTKEDIARYHLILWGDANSNELIAKVNDQLPIHWTKDSLKVGEEIFAAETHVPLLIYPNPLDARRYVVLNSGPTHREAHDRTNSLQNPKLPDWAIVDVTTPPDDQRPGRIVAADFFDEQWQLPASR